MYLEILTSERSDEKGRASQTLFVGNDIPQGMADELILSVESFIEAKLRGRK